MKPEKAVEVTILTTSTSAVRKPYAERELKDHNPKMFDYKSLIKTISMIAGSVALIGIVVGLYFQILPESNVVIRYAEIGFFSFCIPVLIGEAWLRLKEMKCNILHVKVFLGIISTCLLLLLYQAYLNGGILTYEFIAVVSLTAMIIGLIAVGAESISRMFLRLRPNSGKIL